MPIWPGWKSCWPPLPAEERQDALNYYEEYFDAAGSEQEEKTAEALGDPAEVARKILEGEGIALQETTVRGKNTCRHAAAGSKALAGNRHAGQHRPAGPEPPATDHPAAGTDKGIPAPSATPKRVRRRLWIIYWLLIALALAIQISALVFGLRGFPGKGGDTASMAVEGGVSEPDGTEVDSHAHGSCRPGSPGRAVTYSGVLDAPGEGTFYVNLTRGNVGLPHGGNRRRWKCAMWM